MQFQLLFRVGLTLTALALFASWAQAVHDAESDPVLLTQPTGCYLHLHIDEQGTATVSLHLLLPKPLNVPPERFEKILAEVVGVASLQQLQRIKTAGRSSLLIHGRADRAFQ